MLATRKEKNREKDTNYFFELEKVRKHFFEDLDNKFNNINDPRHQSYITYNSNILLMMTILKNAFDLKSMRHMTDQLNRDECIHNVHKILGGQDLQELPPIMTPLMTIYPDLTPKSWKQFEPI